LSCQCVLENRSLFKEIYTLPNASLFKFTAERSLKKDTYFYPDIWENQPWLEKEYFFEKIKNVLRKILPRYFRSNEKIGISLTGGLDTRIIMGQS
jgi:asparagine synthase (glutamine-hydrolysing)